MKESSMSLTIAPPLSPDRVPVTKQKCPVCTRPVLEAKAIYEDKKGEVFGLWYRCLCGVIFQSGPPVKVPKDATYVAKHHEIKEYEDVAIYPATVYAPVIEELTYGRKMLDVGYCTTNNMEFFRKRGWITYGIENNKDTIENERIIYDDFETTEKLYQKHYDLVWMGSVLEKLHNPVIAMAKAYEILQEDGVLYIATPDIGFLYSYPATHWNHWKMDENYIMFSEEALCRELNKIGFNIIFKWRNFNSRFGYYHNIHLIAQKVYY